LKVLNYFQQFPKFHLVYPLTRLIITLMTSPSANYGPVPFKRIIRVWWPLAASWLLMGAELPALSAVVARLANPEINLAAYGGIVFPLALLIESPIIMLLAASTALSKDLDSYQKIYRFMMVTSAALTILHVLIAFTPLYYFVAEKLIGAPQDIIEPARTGLMIMTPWTWSIAYRRFNQGVLIRFDRSKAVGVGTAIRLITDISVLITGYMIGSIPGIVVATTAVASGVIFEAAYIGFVVRPVVRNRLQTAPPLEEPLTLRAFLDFYIPLALTSLLILLVQPIGSASLSRMPNALASLAVWPVLSGLVFMLRSLGVAYNEVVVALLDEPFSSQNLRRFSIVLSASTTAIMLVITATPLSGFWFGTLSGLPPDLTAMAVLGMWLGLLMPGLSVWQSWYQGVIMHSRRTRGITEAVVVFLATCTALLWAGVVWSGVTGLYVGMTAFVVASAAQTGWLWFRSRPGLDHITCRDEEAATLSLAGSTTD
jgi:hypothetical protein